MANKHYRRWLLKMPLGFLFISAGIIIIMYFIHIQADEEWVMWTAASIVAFVIGLLFLGSAYAHKIKSDLIKKGKPRSKSHEEEEHNN
jgi:uncharacterized membrane protein HdeD (DUF308 family)